MRKTYRVVVAAIPNRSRRLVDVWGSNACGNHVRERFSVVRGDADGHDHATVGVAFGHSRLECSERTVRGGPGSKRSSRDANPVPKPVDIDFLTRNFSRQRPVSLDIQYAAFAKIYFFLAMP